MLQDDTLYDVRSYPGMHIEINEDGEAVAIFEEMFAWHLKNHKDLMKKLTDKDGWFTKDAMKKAEVFISKLMKDPKKLSVEHCSGDSPGIEVSYGIGKHNSEESAWKAAHPLYATMMNVTDPGTFGSEYIIAALTR